ncbi:MAG: hypothetical protein J6K00_04035 [Oscillospiraceae bacterium]|nr:hypothetical protein [Oscillospiraceae bacterium]
MKKITALVLAMLMTLALCACGGDDAPSGAETGKDNYSPDYGELYYVSGEVKFGIMDPAEEVLDALGEPQDTFESDSCAYQGKDMFYYYDGFEVMVNDVDGTLRITGITLADDTVSNPQGVKIGMDMDEALSLMGAPDYPDSVKVTQSGGVYKLVSGSTMLRLKAGDDGTLAAAEYCVAANQTDEG